MEPNQCNYKYHNQTKIKCNLTYFAIYHFVKKIEKLEGRKPEHAK